jgi:SRSO17 transposase
MDRIAADANGLLGRKVGTGLYIDDSAFAKKGEQSVGVARQWNGRLGKQDNCQVGVFGALGRADRVCLIDARLYLPKEWTEDPERCERADIPRVERLHRTKLELAQEIIVDARRKGVRFDWVGVDGGYGNSLEFLQFLQERDEVFVADIHSDRHIYLSDPAPIPASAGTGPTASTPHEQGAPGGGTQVGEEATRVPMAAQNSASYHQGKTGR